MIKLQKLILKNFNNVSFAEIDLNSPIVLLVGDNGCGKSSVVDAIALCLSDKKRADTLGQFVKIGTTRAEIELFSSIEDNPLYFNIKINRGESQTTTDRLARYLDKEYSGSDVSTLIKELELDYYSDIFISMQNEDDITKMTPSVRSNYIQKLLAFSFDSQIKTLDDAVKDFTDKVTSTNSSMSAIQSQIEVLKNQYQTKVEISESEKLEYNNALSQKADLDKYIVENTAALRKNAILNSEISKLTNNLLSVTEKYNTVSNKLQAVKNAELIISELENKNAELLSANEVLNNQLTDLNKDNIAKMAEVDSCTAEMMELQTKISEAQLNANNAELNFNKINQDKCPYCNQPIPKADKEHFEHIKVEAAKILEELKLSKSSISDKLSNCKASQLSVEKEISKISTSISANNIAITSNNNKIKAENDIISNSAEDQKLLDSLAFETQEIKNTIALKESDIIKIDNNEWNRAQETLESLNKIIDKYQKVLSDNAMVDATNLNIDKNIEINSKLLEEQSLLLTKYGEEIDLRKEAKLIFEKKLPQFIIIKTCKGLENKLNSYVRSIFSNIYVKLLYKKKGVEFFYATNCDTIPEEIDEKDMLPIKQASGFEKAVLSLCFKAVLCEAYNLPFCILDEVDSAASDSNSKKLFEIIINGGFFKQSMIISHKPTVIESIKTMADNVTAYLVDAGVFTRTV